MLEGTLQHIIVYSLIVACVDKAAVDAIVSFNDLERNITVHSGSTQKLSWSYNGTSSDFAGVLWSTYIPSSPKVPTNLKTIWGIDPSGLRDATIKEQNEYKGRLTAEKNGNTLSLTIEDIVAKDTNLYFCTLVIVYPGNENSEAIRLIVEPEPASNVEVNGISVTAGNVYSFPKNEKVTIDAAGDPVPEVACIANNETKNGAVPFNIVVNSRFNCTVSNVAGSVNFILTTKEEKEIKGLSDEIIGGIVAAAVLVSGVTIVVVCICCKKECICCCTCGEKKCICRKKNYPCCPCCELYMCKVEDDSQSESKRSQVANASENSMKEF